MLDQRLAAAKNDLRSDLESLDPPPFKPNRSAAPAMFIVALLLGIGIVGYVARTRPDDTGGISVATQPDVPDAPVEELPTEDVPADGQTVVVPAPVGPEALGPDGQPAGQATPISRWRTLASPAPGEFSMPLPSADAWSPDEAKVIVYRTGAASPGHLVYNTFDQDAEPIELPFVPADIEQVYWHPLEQDRLLYTAGPDLMNFDLATGSTTTEHSFDGCDSVDSGVLPVSPALDGSVSLLCRAGDDTSQVAYDLSSGDEIRVPTRSDTAALPSPSGNLFVRWNPDNSASVLDRSLTDTGVVLDLAGNVFGFVTDNTGREWVAATLFDGEAIGSVVLLPLDGASDPIVVIGPDRGDAYPPTGTLISANGDKIVIGVRGPDDGLAGNITLLDLADSFTDPTRWSTPHMSAGLHDYWSTPFVSVSRSGVIAYSSDRGGDSVNTYIGNFIGEPPD